MKSLRKKINHAINWISSIFLNGLFTILPLTLTVALFTFVFNQIIKWLAPLKFWLIQHNILSAPLSQSFFSCIQVGKFSFQVPYIEVFLVLILIFIIGLVMHNIVLKRLLHGFLQLIESFMFQIPLIRSVYGGIKQLVHAFSMQDKLSFKRVVFVEFPRHGIYSLGFLTSELPAEVAPNKEGKYYNIFIPTTPNPTSGFFVILPETSISVVNLSRQEAMAMIISGGIIQPERFMRSDKEYSEKM